MEFIYLYNLLMPTKLFLMNSVQVVDSQRIIKGFEASRRDQKNRT